MSRVTSEMVRCTAWRTARSFGVLLPGAQRRGRVRARPPEPVEEATAPVDHLVRLVRPVHVVERRPGEEMEEAEGIGTHRIEVVLRRDEVSLGLGHLGPVHADHPLREVVREGFRPEARSKAHVDERTGVEARVQEVEDGVLDPADVLVDGHEMAGRSRVERPVRAPRIAEAQEVPGRVDERVHGVGLAPGRPSVDRAGGVEEPLVERER